MVAALGNVVKRWGSRPAFATVMSKVLPPVDRAVSKVTFGKLTVADMAAPTLLLTTTGRKTGEARTVPLVYLVHGGSWVVTASNWGKEHPPAWSLNLLAGPRATVTLDGKRTAVVAREAEPAERARLWQQVTKVWPAYDAYAERAAHRDIKVFVLERAI